ncbi:hypothetical protein OBBRIDRAFT_76536 [Obba rivulosa]|uniref:Uncharacterized protein n=1 Tax=Obba rivulosa TaxID=1052685 RepID=A0A8E2DS28_9APHY|nr:hypothetical protein OBBRIDRAFT_76536 [Obba rivulosa]
MHHTYLTCLATNRPHTHTCHARPISRRGCRAQDQHFRARAAWKLTTLLSRSPSGSEIANSLRYSFARRRSMIVTPSSIPQFAAHGTRRHITTFAFKPQIPYGRKRQKAAFVEDCVRKHAAQPGGPDSKGAHGCICSTERRSKPLLENHVKVEFMNKKDVLVATERVLVPWDEHQETLRKAGDASGTNTTKN